MYDQQNPSCRQPRRSQAEPENEAASDSDLEAAPVNARGKRGRRSAGFGRPDVSEAAATPGRKRHRASAESAGDADEVSLLSPDKSQKIKGRVSASGVVVSVKDGRVLSRHLELKQTFPTSYRNAKNTNT